jgi:tripartite-type tricarboxylate transporter receptor subunit TctC
MAVTRRIRRPLRITRRQALGMTAAIVATPILPLAAQVWPSRPIRVLVGTAAGGSPDIVSRIIGEKLAERLGQSFVTEINTQGAGLVSQQIVSRSAPDGHTMLMMTGGYPPQTVLRNLGFHPLDGFSFVTTICGYPMVYAVAPDSPIKSFPDLLARAKADPGKLTYTITSRGSIYHMLTSWIEIEAGISMTPIPYRGSAQALQDILGGRVDVMVDAATSMFPRIRSGQLRLLAVSSAGRFPLMPEAPTVGESVPGIEFMSWLGLAMAPGTPSVIIDRLNQEVRRALALPDVQARLVEGGNVAIPSTPQEYRERVEREVARWRRVIAAAGIKAE